MKSEIMDLDSMELMDVVKELYRLLAADVPCKDEIPWLKCIGGCTVDENKEVISLTCLHSVCSNKCVSKLKKYRLPDKKDESHCCPICELEVAPEDLQRRVVPSQVFIKKTDHTDIVLVCENCVLDLPAVAYCVDCPACLCQQCKKV
ncbi:hypothetical protein Ocin01_07325 [Orchesella cincta]|uniref:RING-type domain-containing protein n=1 Tax=Orchesella cincta TaxID=48709 RepID=A0A1D2N268_ORCCI|nr:hypothetical protein Ocin01_07325 [Orchesella cincta]